ncbi:Protein-glutamate O-methyltransferase [Sulfidibacter corallicola]|uniref:protein-glutamate O-methyltransferase n=1 Tax=Sulfidibacter corallicola TaxID=2818388 RepID=A0A8A4TIT3_SULCO|nr:protein-glutamate O-methyltransferase CheR [Sulfidibacter corallicola]QTD48761.1 protein-glutamate O-methyltransferase CheR [Sulfidibacter corallicola]
MRIRIGPNELQEFRAYVNQLTGIELDETKAYLFESRLLPLLRHYACDTFTELLLRGRGEREVEDAIIDAMTTEESYFFRDGSPFELAFHKLIPDVIDAQKRRRKQGPVQLRIWSAASSYGQEAYSIAMICKELLRDLSGYRIAILGTDISPFALARARRAVYSKFELSRGMTLDRLRRHFDQTEDGYRVKPELTQLCRFERINLHHSLQRLGSFDIIFCRNVAVYFSQENRRRLFDQISGRLNDPGFLVIGATENLIGVSDRYARLEFQGKSYYRVAGPKSEASRATTWSTR